MQIFADRFMSSGHPAATSTPSKGGSSKDVLNRLRGMPNMKQVLQGRDTINKVLEEVPHLKAGCGQLWLSRRTDEGSRAIRRRKTVPPCG